MKMRVVALSVFCLTFLALLLNSGCDMGTYNNRFEENYSGLSEPADSEE